MIVLYLKHFKFLDVIIQKQTKYINFLVLAVF